MPQAPARAFLAVVVTAPVLLLSGGLAAATAHVDATLRVCGQETCRTYKGHLDDIDQLLDADRAVRQPAAAGSYFKLRLTTDGAPGQIGYYVPRARALRWNTTPRHFWVPTTDAHRNWLSQYASGPGFRAPTPVHVFVNGRSVRNRRPYLALFGTFRHALVGGDAVPIRLEWASPNPWSGEGRMEFYPEVGVLVRRGEAFKLPRALASRLKQDAGSSAA